MKHTISLFLLIVFCAYAERPFTFHDQAAMASAMPAAPAPPATTEPDDIAGLIAWWKADSLTNTADGSEIVYWQDASGNGLNATPPLYGPLYKANAQNGKPSAVFYEGGFTGLGFTAPAVANFTVFLVLQSTNAAADAGPLSFRTAGNAGFGIVGDGSAYRAHVVVYSDSAETLNQSGTAEAMPGEWRILCATYNGSEANLWTNNVADTLTARGFGYNLSAGSIGVGYTAWFGEIGEIVVYNSALGESDVAAIYDYLATKWGL